MPLNSLEHVLYMHNHDDESVPTGTPGDPRLKAPVDTNEPSGPTGPTLYKVMQMFCVYCMGVNTGLGSASFDIPAVIQSVCLKANDKG